MAETDSQPIAENEQVKELLALLKDNNTPGYEEFSKLIEHVTGMEQRLLEATEELKAVRQEMQGLQNHSFSERCSPKELYSYGGEYFRYASPSFRTQRPDHKRVQEYPCRFQGTRYCRFEWDHTVFTCQTGVGVHSKCSRKKYAGQQQGCCQN